MGHEVKHRNILYKGLPGCGKSTIIEKIVQRINRPSTGFFTREIRDKGRRGGFSITTLDGQQGILAHIDIRNHIRVGRYGVNIRDIEKIAVPSMRPENDSVILVVDEIGYELNPGDLMFVPKDNHVKYECDDKCVIFYTAYPVDWKQRAGITHVPGIDADEMPAPYEQ